jgi:hypothetical protein
MALLNIDEKTVGIWFLALTDDCDWMCGVSETEPEKKYQINYRFRYHKDDKVFDSADEKSSYGVKASCTRSFAIATVRHIASEMKAKGAIGEIDELLMQDGDVDRFLKEFRDKPYVYIRVEGRIKP